MKHIVLNILLLFALITNAQDYKRASIWYFGENAGLDFNTEPPTALLNGKINTIEGCATICDTNGNLLFYTDGRTVWNKNHDTMLNGTGLLGEQSQTQAALIVPYPDKDSLYYIFTTRRGVAFNAGLYYNLVNINGIGEVIEKNKLLKSPISEKLAATRHRNNRDYWVTTTGYNDNNLFTFLVTNKGLIICPVISSVPKNFSSSTALGALKFSTSGKLAAIAKNSTAQVDLLSFNNATGTFAFLFSLNHSTAVYGVEFSKSEKYLYMSDRLGSLFQYSLSNLILAQVIVSRQTIYTFTPSNDLQALQLGLNNKIYMAFPSSKYLGVINSPDTTYNFVNFDTTTVFLGGKRSLYGLPAMVSSFLYQPALDFSYSLDCETNQISLTPKTNLLGNYNWDISKSGGSSVFTANSFSTNYTFQDTGWFDVELSVTNSTDTIIVKKQLHIKPVYKLKLGKDTTLCIGQSLVLNAGNGQYCYLWQDSSTNPSFLADTAGVYYVRVFSQNLCVHNDTITISYSPNPTKPTIYNSNDTLYSPIASSYKWFKNGVLINGANDTFYKPTQNGFYQVMVFNTFGCSALSDSFQIKGLSVDKLNAQDYFRIYPIPAGNQLFIEPIINISIKEINLIDAIGKEHLFSPTNEIDLAAFSKGIYYLKITDNQSNTYITKFIIN